MSTEPPATPSPESDHGATRAWVRPVALVVSCLVIGFVGGWVVRGDDGTVTVLAPATGGDASDAGSTTGEGAVTAPTTTRQAPPTPLPARADIALAVLNGTDEGGAAGRTAAQAESLGYEGVTAGNAPTSTGPSIVYFRPGGRPAAGRVGRDLEIVGIRALPRSGALADAAPDDADVVVVLGPG